jgi:hypothetical protein
MTTLPFNRRDFLKTTSSGFGYMAFAALAHEQALRAKPPRRAAGTEAAALRAAGRSM